LTSSGLYPAGLIIGKKNYTLDPTKEVCNTTPNMSENIQLDFFAALQNALLGRKVSRKAWGDKRAYFSLQDDFLQIHKKGETDSTFHPWTIHKQDLEAVDWYVI